MILVALVQMGLYQLCLLKGIILPVHFATARLRLLLSSGCSQWLIVIFEDG